LIRTGTFVLLLAFAASLSGQAVKNRAPLPADAFYPLPLTSVKPTGWLRAQLRIQADGMSGHLDEFWPDVGANSGWLGGNGESWERGPYYLDGLTPLAYLFDDQKLIAKVQKWVNWTLDNQREDGFLGPAKNNGWWPRMVMLKVLAQYYEATRDPRVLPAMQKYFAYQRRQMSSQPLERWAQHRWGDELWTVLWLYNRTGNLDLLELARMLHAQGFDWKKYFDNFPYAGKIARNQANQDTHVVNNAMSLKTFTLWSLVSGDPADRRAIYTELEKMDRYNLMPEGVHSGDEHYAGKSPVQGTELCAVVEGMFSIEQLIAVAGDPAFADRLEKIAYNALPGTFDKAMWAHQYDQQPNQVLVDVNPRSWTTNKPDSNLYGLEPNFGCCTANFHQGWPKFAASLWMATPDDGLAAVAYGPSVVNTKVNGNVAVSVSEETEYPFRDSIRLTVKPASPATFPLVLRVPAWAANASIKVNGHAEGDVKPGSFHRLQREWKPGDTVVIRFPMQPRVTRWYNNSAVIERGPLVYSLRIGEDWRKLRDHGPAADWEVRPTTPWNYAINAKSIQVKETPVGQYPFSPEGAPVELRVKARRLPAWQMENGSAAPPPLSPVASSERAETVTLIPYGAAKLRITEFPELKN
jgi:DUF1680 family protein